MLANKHIVVAMIIAPLLAIAAYFVADAWVSEKPHKAIAGRAYPLVASSNCRYPSELCTFKNASFEINIKSRRLNQHAIQLILTSSHELQGAKFAIVADQQQSKAPADLEADNRAQTRWTITLASVPQQSHQLRIVLAAKDTVYYGETSMHFLSYDTVYKKDLRGEAKAAL